MTAQEIIAKLKSLKIGKGCKFSFISNSVSISYPAHKSCSFDEESQWKKEKAIIMSIFSYDITGTTTVNSRKNDNKGGIQIQIL